MGAFTIVAPAVGISASRDRSNGFELLLLAYYWILSCSEKRIV